MDGILLINKDKDWTSFDVVAKMRNMLKTKIGHTGTLDPMATGLLVLLLGSACKLERYLVIDDKTYIAEMKIGLKTNTGDLSGETVKKEKFDLKDFSEEDILKVLDKFTGKIKQIPPKYSALKFEGESLYRLAREELVSKEEMNKILKSKEREIEIYSIDLLEIDYVKNILKLKVSCSTGTYIRTLIEDIAEIGFNSIATLKNLDRLTVGKYKIEDSKTIKSLEILDRKDIKKIVLEIEEAFSDFPKTRLEKSRVYYFKNGVRVTNKIKDGLYRVYSFDKENGTDDSTDKFVGLGLVEDNLMKREYIYEDK